MKVIYRLLALMFFTASFDKVLALDLGGTVRFAQIVLVLVILAAIGHVLQNNVVLWPRGGNALLLWTVLQGLLISQSLTPLASVELYILLMLAVLGIFAVVQLYGASQYLPSLMRIYLLSYVFVAAFAMVQFVSPALHLGAPLVVQWIRHGLIPRLNGFNYEPSYFATYMIMGWIALVDLRVTGAVLTSGRKWFWYTMLVSAALFLSTSKTAWLGMGLEGFARLAPIFWRVSKRQIERHRIGSLVIPLPRLRVLLAIGLILVLVAAGLTAVSRLVDLNMFLAGTGINGTAAHSFNDRFSRANDTTAVILQHPWVGRSLGGVPSAIAALHGVVLVRVSDQRAFWGFPVPLDVLAASGIPAFLPFLWFFLVITVGESKLIRDNWQDDRAKWLHALIRALAFEWFALLSDQYLLRIYFWFHVSMVVVVGYSLRYAKTKKFASAESMVMAS